MRRTTFSTRSWSPTSAIGSWRWMTGGSRSSLRSAEPSRPSASACLDSCV